MFADALVYNVGCIPNMFANHTLLTKKTDGFFFLMSKGLVMANILGLNDLVLVWALVLAFRLRIWP